MEPTREQIVRSLRETRGGLDDADDAAVLRIWRTMDPADRKAAVERITKTTDKAARPVKATRRGKDGDDAPATESQ